MSKRRGLERRPTGGSVLILVALVVAVATLSPTIQQLIGQRQHIAQLEDEIATTTEDIEGLEQEQARWDDPAYVRAEARGRLLFVEPGDTTYVVVDESTPQAPYEPVDVSVEVHETTTDSGELFLDSLIRSSTAEAPQETP
ncbi:FtsB family cell division protein [Gulosibacter chungangensis]|uniref:Septum formation initiator family protein n=1 Tax=Gulosibacter chungangensis TaxID=979746 RepID=A0A7J5BAY4_9MICO|nr:septum formation initiator family protein [Gulosibacter chungangensis]KAB1643252.1 septum formation initiator family protein [Gulosibacter chungangensis]